MKECARLRIVVSAKRLCLMYRVMWFILTNYLEHGSEVAVITCRLFPAFCNWPSSPSYLWTPKLCCNTDNPSLDRVLSHSNLIQTFFPSFCKINLLSSSHLCPGVPNGQFLLRFLIFCMDLSSSLAWCSSRQLALYYFVILIIFIFVTKLLITQLPSWSC
jgi:hypothetical protein